MTLNAVVRAANDSDLQSRVSAAIYEEAINNAALKDSVFAMQVKGGYPPPFTALYWAVAQAVQTEYDYGVSTGRGSPGHDPDVITDGAITAAVAANWPADPVPAPTLAAAQAAPATAPTPAPTTKVVSKRGTK